MSDNDNVPVLDDQTQALIYSITTARVEAALEERAKRSALQQHEIDETGEASVEVDVVEGAEPAAEGGRGYGSNQAGKSPEIHAEEDEEPGDKSEVINEEDEEDSDSDSGDQGPQPFSARWYEDHSRRPIPNRFAIPARFVGQLPVGFQPESVDKYSLFTAGGARNRRESEARSHFVSAAYLAEISNSIARYARLSST